MDPYVALLSVIVFLPALGALALAFLPSDKPDFLRYFTLLVTILALVPTTYGFFMDEGTHFDAAVGTMQDAFSISWIPSFNIYYSMGVDGISFPLVMLTVLVSALAMGASWSIKKHVKAYCILFLLLETGMLGVFLALDFFLFYVFWEVMLLPMYFLIGVWGGERREYAAIKFFLYTLFGSVLMLIAILMIYFNSDVRAVAAVSDFYGDTTQPVKWNELNASRNTEERLGRVQTGAVERGQQGHNARLSFTRKSPTDLARLSVAFKTGTGSKPDAVYDADARAITVNLAADGSTAEEVVAAVIANAELASVVHVSHGRGSDGSGLVIADDTGQELIIPVSATNPEGNPAELHSFNLLMLSAMGQNTTVFSPRLQWWAFLLLFIGFAIKVPSVPLHTWLPDAHVQAPTPISMILAGVLLKMGGYGIIRICYPICPHGGYDLMYFVCTVGVVSMVYGAFAALAQKDFKRMVAYSSVSHMGYVVLGLGVWSANPYFWNMGVQGAMFQMIAHGISSTGMFFMVGVLYDRVHHRNLDEFGGLFGKMPVYTAFSIGIFFAGLGLPGLCGFIGEVFVVLSVWSFSITLAVISAAVVILTAGYILWAIQRVYLGAEYRGPHEEALVPATSRENTIAGILFVLAIVFGVFPYQTVLRYMQPTIDRQIDQLTTWRGDARIRTKDTPEKNEAAPPPKAPEVTSVLPATESREELASDLAIPVGTSPGQFDPGD